jgi:ABC-2 type transport system ATP-binding protein
MNHGKLMAEGTPHEIVGPLVGHMLELAAVPQRTARDVARHLASVLDVQVFGDRLHLRVDDTARVIEQLPQTLASAGVTVTLLRPAEPTLEDVFTELLSRGS